MVTWAFKLYNAHILLIDVDGGRGQKFYYLLFSQKLEKNDVKKITWSELKLSGGCACKNDLCQRMRPCTDFGVDSSSNQVDGQVVAVGVSDVMENCSWIDKSKLYEAEIAIRIFGAWDSPAI